MLPDAPLSPANARDDQDPLLVAHEAVDGAGTPHPGADANDAVLQVVFERIRRDLSFISRHHPQLKMSGDELHVWAKAIARQLTSEPMVGSDKKDMMH